MAIVAASFPGIVQIYSVHATSYLGIFPGVAQVQFLPQTTLAYTDGNLFLTDALQSTTWVDAHIDRTSLRFNRRGQMVAATVLDRRVWWKFSVIHGLYNERDPDEQIIAASEKTPQELAALLFDAMGEIGYDVSALPNDATDRPLANWSCANAAEELHRLCRERGCDIALNYVTNAAVIVQLGVGATIPAVNIQSVSVDVDIGEIPETLMVCTGETVVQAKFELEAVGEDTDGQFRPLDELSYAPDDWTKEVPGALLPGESENVRALAERSVYCMYRIKNFSDGGLTVPGIEIELDDIYQCLPLSSTLVQVYDDPVLGKIHREAYVEGTYIALKRDGLENVANSNDNVRVDIGFRLYPETGYVQFFNPVFKQADDGGYEPAQLYLTAAFSVRATTDRQYIRYVRYLSLGGVGTQIISRRDLVLTILGNYDPSDPTALESVTENEDQVTLAADAILQAALPQFETQTAGVVKYIGTLAVVLDGITRQITWINSRETGANTLIGRNCEPEYGVARANERVRLALQLGRAYENIDLRDRMNDLKTHGRSRRLR